ncbi:unnamed protein product [Dibothriocephalus latus]|uniref:Uncharacterized protein n=1 Tax=Dibothriocephalus latus TaxID=60516 RepID=A0A3P7LX48_DIBLA|nr:unnamed protein product [Dibothriocephalus latus]
MAPDRVPPKIIAMINTYYCSTIALDLVHKNLSEPFTIRPGGFDTFAVVHLTNFATLPSICRRGTPGGVEEEGN